MDRKILINKLRLTYSPLSNYEFSALKKDEVIRNLMDKSKIYVVAQRPVLSFENISPDYDNGLIYFEIHQKNNSYILKITLPIFQEDLVSHDIEQVAFGFLSIDKKQKWDLPPFDNVNGIVISANDKFLLWSSPEKFLQNYWNGRFMADVAGDIRDFLRFKVHYVGKATDQHIWKRMSGHSTLQDIISLEYPISENILPTHEIVLLFFELQDSIAMNSYGPESENIDSMVNDMLGLSHPDLRTIYLDAEKALIKSMQPGYNKELYNNYPQSLDGLSKFNLNAFMYTFVDPICLTYENGEIEGGLNEFGGDTIIIEDNMNLKIVKH